MREQFDMDPAGRSQEILLLTEWFTTSDFVAFAMDQKCDILILEPGMRSSLITFDGRTFTLRYHEAMERMTDPPHSKPLAVLGHYHKVHFVATRPLPDNAPRVMKHVETTGVVMNEVIVID